MRYIDFRQEMVKYPVFSKKDLFLLFPKTNFNTLNKQLTNWVENGALYRLRRGVYLLSPEYLKHDIQPMFLASKIYEPSYISLAFALSFYNIIPEAAFEITSITTKSLRKFTNRYGTYKYRAVDAKYFFGYSTKRVGNITYNIATKEKALLDYLYFHKTAPERLNLNEINFTQLKQLAVKIKNRQLQARVNNLYQDAKSA